MKHQISRRTFLKLTGAAAASLATSAATSILPAFAIAQSPRVLRIGANAWPANLDVQNQAGPSNVGRRIFSLIHDALIIFDRQGALVPQLATEWANDGVEWRFTLREGVRFQDGSILTPEDVIYSFQRMFDPEGDQSGLASYGRSLTRYIASVEKTGELEVTMTTNFPDPLLAYRLATHFAPIVPQAATEALGDTGVQQSPVGAGPYAVVEFTTDRLVLRKHDMYWGGAPGADEVILRFIPEDATRVSALQAGEVDIITNLPVDQFATIASTSGLDVKSTLLLNYIGINLNTNVGPLTDVNIRRAMGLAVDRELIVRELWGDRSRAMDDYLLPNVVGYDGSAGTVRYDLDAARAALDASGYAGEPIVFNPVTNYYSNSELPTQVMNQMWTDIGLNMTYEPLDLGSYFQSYLGGQLTCNIQSYDVFGDGMFLFQLWQPDSPIPIYRPNYFVPDESFDALALDIQNKFDIAERATDLRQMSNYFANVVPMIPMYQSVEILGIREGVNIEADPLFQLNLRPDSFSM